MNPKASKILGNDNPTPSHLSRWRSNSPNLKAKSRPQAAAAGDRNSPVPALPKFNFQSLRDTIYDYSSPEKGRMVGVASTTSSEVSCRSEASWSKVERLLGLHNGIKRGKSEEGGEKFDEKGSFVDEDSCSVEMEMKEQEIVETLLAPTSSTFNKPPYLSASTLPQTPLPLRLLEQNINTTFATSHGNTLTVYTQGPIRLLQKRRILSAGAVTCWAWDELADSGEYEDGTEEEACMYFDFFLENEEVDMDMDAAFLLSCIERFKDLDVRGTSCILRAETQSSSSLQKETGSASSIKSGLTVDLAARSEWNDEAKFSFGNGSSGWSGGASEEKKEGKGRGWFGGRR